MVVVAVKSCLRPVISTVLGSLSGDAAVTCDFAWYFPGTEVRQSMASQWVRIGLRNTFSRRERLRRRRRTPKSCCSKVSPTCLSEGSCWAVGYEHYLKANYVDMEHRKTCKADGRWSSLRRDTGSAVRGL